VQSQAGAIPGLEVSVSSVSGAVVLIQFAPQAERKLQQSHRNRRRLGETSILFTPVVLREYCPDYSFRCPVPWEVRPNC
jgi:hypothetical protein